MDSKDSELRSSSQQVEDLSTRNIETYGRDTLRVDVEAIGFKYWQQMIDATQKDYKERGMVVSKKGQKLFTSKIFEVPGEQFDYENPDKRKTSGSFTPPFLPHGIRSLYPGMKDLTVIHTHPMPPKLDHIRTTTFSDEDIKTFINADYNGLVMIDRSGAHLLVHNRTSYSRNELLKMNIVDEALKSVREKDGGSVDVMKSVAHTLASYGLGYFYLVPDTKGYVVPDTIGYVEFNNAKNLDPNHFLKDKAEQSKA